MELQAMQGYDTYWVNVRSYGNSTRLPNTYVHVIFFIDTIVILIVVSQL